MLVISRVPVVKFYKNEYWEGMISFLTQKDDGIKRKGKGKKAGEWKTKDQQEQEYYADEYSIEMCDIWVSSPAT